ncbi:MAG: exodeoxyribonuclease III [Polyangiales bacterium]
MLKVSTWNVNGIRARKDELPLFIERERPDVLCLQETKAPADKVPDNLTPLMMSDYWAYWHGHGGYSGVALLLKKERFPAQPVFSHPEFDHESRIVVAETPGLTLTSIYVPNGGKDFEAKLRFLDALEAYAKAKNEQPLLLCGDLNVAREERDVHPSLRKRDQIGTTPDERAQFARILGHGLIDLGRQFAPDDDRLFTWWAPWRNLREKNVGWRIDYVLASGALAAKAQSCACDREFGKSDHGPLTAVFDL